MKFLLLLALFVVFMVIETDGGQVEDGFTLFFNTVDSDKDGKISRDDMKNSKSSFMDYSHQISERKVQNFSPFPS